MLHMTLSVTRPGIHRRPTGRQRRVRGRDLPLSLLLGGPQALLGARPAGLDRALHPLPLFRGGVDPPDSLDPLGSVVFVSQGFAPFDPELSSS